MCNQLRYVRVFSFLLAGVIFAGCNTQSNLQPPAGESSFAFSVDPQSNIVTLVETSTGAISALQADGTRILVRGVDLELEDFQLSVSA